MRLFQFLVLNIFLGISTFATLFAQATITCNAPSYAGKEIIFKVQADPFSLSEKEVGKCIVPDNGVFTIQLNINQTSYIFTHIGVYLGFMYVEPGKNYEITLPDYLGKSNADMLNPYFEEISVQLPLKNSNDKDLNFLIRSFDDAYFPYFKKFAGNIRSRTNKATLDSAVLFLNNFKTESTNTFFNNYVYYKTGMLKHLAFQQRSKAVSKEYFQDKPILYNNPAYIDLFNQVYNKYLLFYSRTSYGKPILNDINVNKSLYGLSQTLIKDSVLLNDTLREFVILKNIYDEFYFSNYTREGLLTILDSTISNTKIVYHKQVAEALKYKMTKLMVGFIPPQFELLDSNGQKHLLSDFKGKYVYLNFCSCNSYSCIKEFELLKAMNEKHKDILTIITVVSGETMDEMKEFLAKSGYSWLFLHYGNQLTVIDDYDIRAYPTYFFIGPDGKLIYSPAASPGENFEYYLFKALRAKGEI
jgi:peroxiredoxin